MTQKDRGNFLIILMNLDDSLSENSIPLYFTLQFNVFKKPLYFFAIEYSSCHGYYLYVPYILSFAFRGISFLNNHVTYGITTTPFPLLAGTSTYTPSQPPTKHPMTKVYTKTHMIVLCGTGADVGVANACMSATLRNPAVYSPPE